MQPATCLPKLTADARLAGWLLAAILAHALLLLVPAQYGARSGEALPGLAVALLRPPLQPPATASAPRKEPPPAPLQTQPDSSPVATADAVLPPPQDADMPAEPPPASAAYLLDLAGRREWRLTEPAETRKLGKFVPGPPANWRSATALEPNRFDGMATAAELEVVDRWLAADGSQNTVVTTPDGETYCGRQEAWNPMSPLLEPLMQFRACGGGGKPTFEMQHPYREDAAQRRRR